MWTLARHRRQRPYRTIEGEEYVLAVIAVLTVGNTARAVAGLVHLGDGQVIPQGYVHWESVAYFLDLSYIL